MSEEAEENASLMDDLAEAWGDADDGMDTDLATADRHEESTDELETANEIVPEETVVAEAAVEPIAGDEAAGGPDAAKAAAPAADEATAPSSWTPEAREGWKDLPAASQKYIKQREAEFEAGIVKYAGNAKRAEVMDQVLGPYQQYLQMNGGAGSAIQGLLQSGATLQMGSPAQKAETVARLIGQYGVDITALDNILVGQAPAAVDPVQSQIQEAVAPYQQFMQQFQQNQNNQQQQAQAAVVTEVDQFGGANEFYKDVRGYMADIMDMATNRGQTMTMDQAYTQACKLHPEISKIMDTRAASAALVPKRKAASSISGSRGGAGGDGPVGSLRNTIADAWENAGRV
jgi:hypothetical protein